MQRYCKKTNYCTKNRTFGRLHFGRQQPDLRYKTAPWQTTTGPALQKLILDKKIPIGHKTDSN